MVRERGKHEWLAALEAAGVPCGPINDLGEVFENEQVVARGMQVESAASVGRHRQARAQPDQYERDAA